MNFNEVKTKLESSDLKFNWYKFYTYIKLPLSFIGAILVLAYIFKPLMHEYYFRMWMTPYLTPWVVLAVLYGFTFFGLLHLTRWGFRFNQVLLIIEAFILAYGFYKYVDNLAFAIIFLVVWALAFTVTNFIYFNKRLAYFDAGIISSETELKKAGFAEPTAQEAEIAANITDETGNGLKDKTVEEVVDEAAAKPVKPDADANKMPEKEAEALADQTTPLNNEVINETKTGDTPKKDQQ